MNIETKLEKIINIMQTEDMDHIPEILNTLSTYFDTQPTDIAYSIIPMEANFQLSNTFLRTKKLPEVEKFLIKYNDITSNYKFESLIKILENFKYHSEDTITSFENNECDKEFVKNNIQERY